MKKFVSYMISVLFMIGLVTSWGIVPANALPSGPSASGAYKFVLDDDLMKSVEFSATSDERGTSTGQMTFKDDAVIVEQDPDGEPKEGSGTQFFMTANLDSLTIDGNRALMGGTVVESSNPSYVGKWVQLVVEDNGDNNERPDKLTWCFCQPEEGGWVPADAEVPGDEGAWWKWWATDAEVKDDAGVQSINIIPGNKTSCKVLPLSIYEFEDVRSGEGQIQVQP
jgi:hypothetical protein